jgi:hypothetical protein
MKGEMFDESLEEGKLNPQSGYGGVYNLKF